MRRLLQRPRTRYLLAGAALVLVAAWLLGWWMASAGIVLAGLCLLALVAEGGPLATWKDRLAGWLARRAAPPAPVEAPPAPVVSRPVRQPHASLTEQMIIQGRVALLLRPQIASSLPSADLEAAQAALDETMAIVPQGPVCVRARCFEQMDDESASRAERLVNVEGFFLDRFPVTNRQYYEFVADGGYEQMSLWDEAIWPAVLGFVDRTGQPGPRFWENGCYPGDKEHHPVVGVSWYEACAYARWAGKRLPTDAEWVKAGTWPVFAEGSKPVQRRFPWGDALDRRRVNMWGSGFADTVPVDALPEGASVNGVQQLIGNVWEWTSGSFGAWEPTGRKIETPLPLKSIRGGAFDTYFENQAHCQFQSGESPLARKHNIGFRCAVGFCDVAGATGGAPPVEADEQPTGYHEEVLA